MINIKKIIPLTSIFCSIFLQACTKGHQAPPQEASEIKKSDFGSILENTPADLKIKLGNAS